jgi:hypothetical protein
MKKLTEGRKEIVELAIKQGKESHDAYRQSGLSTFTDEGRKLIKPYWDAQETIVETLNVSITRACSLIDGKTTLEGLYDSEGNSRKAKA